MVHSIGVVQDVGGAKRRRSRSRHKKPNTRRLHLRKGPKRWISLRFHSQRSSLPKGHPPPFKQLLERRGDAGRIFQFAVPCDANPQAVRQQGNVSPWLCLLGLAAACHAAHSLKIPARVRNATQLHVCRECMIGCRAGQYAVVDCSRSKPAYHRETTSSYAVDSSCRSCASSHSIIEFFDRFAKLLVQALGRLCRPLSDRTPWARVGPRLLHVNGKVENRDVNPEYRWTRVYNKKKGEDWRCVLEQHTYVAPKDVEK